MQARHYRRIGGAGACGLLAEVELQGARQSSPGHRGAGETLWRLSLDLVSFVVHPVCMVGASLPGQQQSDVESFRVVQWLPEAAVDD